jgi:hypothetical protein
LLAFNLPHAPPLEGETDENEKSLIRAGQGIRRAVKIDLMGRFFEITIPNATGVVPIGLDKYGDITGYCVPTAITKLRSFILSYPMSCSNKVQQTHRKNRKTAPIQWPLLKPMTVKP